MKHKIFYFFAFMLYFVAPSKAQYLKNYDKDFVYSGDTCIITFTFGNAKFLSFGQLSGTCNINSGSSMNVYIQVEAA
jgi:hypothetical protein